METLSLKIPKHLTQNTAGLKITMATALYEQEVLTLAEAAAMAEITVDSFQGRFSIYLHETFDEPNAKYTFTLPSKRLPIKEELKKKKAQIDQLCKKNNVKTLHIFGSAIRDDFDLEKSDLDFVVDFDKTLSVKGYSDCFFDLLFSFEDLFRRKIDLITTCSISNPFLKSEIDENKKIIYAA